MKTLLVGGSLDGKIVDTKRNTFGYGEVAEIYDKNTGELIRKEDSGIYMDTHKPVKHSCKKKGTVKVFELRADTAV